MNAAQSLLGPEAIQLASRLFTELSAASTGRAFHTEGGVYPFEPEASHYGACIRLDHGAGTVQLAVFGTARSCEQMVRILYQFGPTEPLAPNLIVDALGETLNLLAGRIKQSVFATSGLELHLGLPVRFIGADVRNFATRAIPIRATRVATEGLTERFEIVCSDRSSENLLRELLATLEGNPPEKPLLIRSLGLCEELCEARRESGSDSELAQLRQCVELVASVINGDAPGPREAIDRVRFCARQLLQIHDVAQRLELASAPEQSAGPALEFPESSSIPADDITRESVGGLSREAADALLEAAQLLTSLEHASKDDARIERLCRIFHGIKGEASMWELAELGALAEATERALGAIREGALAPDHDVLAALQRSTALCSELLARIDEALAGEGQLFALRGVAGQIQALAALRPSSDAREARASPGGIAARAAARRSGESTRVEVASLDRLEKLLPSFAELARPLDADDAPSRALRERIHQLGAELENIHAEMRMVPLGPLLTKVGRMARDVATKLEKAIRVVLVGEETRVTRRVFESLSEPFEQLIRYALHLGIETQTERRHTSKPPLATLEISAACAEDGTITVSLCDDGRGLERKRVLAKAQSLGLVEPRAGSALTDAEVFQLIFARGFSTAEQTAAMSEYGIGMEQVPNGVAALGGHIVISSQFGKGTSFQIVIPDQRDAALRSNGDASGGLSLEEPLDAEEINFF